jgi:hypothetical protein
LIGFCFSSFIAGFDGRATCPDEVKERCASLRLPAHRRGGSLKTWGSHIKEMNFGDALALLKQGKRVEREGWNANHTLGLQEVDEGSVNTLPYIYLVVGDDAKDLQGKRVPWVASQRDLLAEDWKEAE